LSPDDTAALARAAALVRAAGGLLIGAGAGIGVDSGLPDFRGDHGLWRAYPPLAAAGIRFVEIANPRQFDVNPALASMPVSWICRIDCRVGTPVPAMRSCGACI
jgi:NAD-dependent SIR2 family protein deacetylase